MKPKNDKGQPIGDSHRFLKEEWNELLVLGKIRNIWELADDVADGEGFDKRHIEPNGKHTMEVTLPKNTILIRYGYESGSYTAPDGTQYDELSLPYVQDTMEFHKYRVIADGITVTCLVNRGKVAPSFGLKGGGVQYKHHMNILRCLQAKEIERLI